MPKVVKEIKEDIEQKLLKGEKLSNLETIAIIKLLESTSFESNFIMSNSEVDSEVEYGLK